MTNTYIVTGFKDWSVLFWQGTFAVDKGKQSRHYLMIELCLQRLNGQLTVIGLERQYGYQRAMKDALDIYHNVDNKGEVWKHYVNDKDAYVSATATVTIKLTNNVNK